MHVYNSATGTTEKTTGPTGTTARERIRDQEIIHERLRASLPVITAVVMLMLGFWVGWSSGRNDLLEDTYLRTDGGMVRTSSPALTP